MTTDQRVPDEFADLDELMTGTPRTWTAGPNTVTVQVVVDGSIRPPDAWWRLTHPAELGG